METQTHQVKQDIKKVTNNLNNFEGNFNLNKSGFDENMPGHTTDHNMILRQQPRTIKNINSGINLSNQTRQEIALMLD
ncbi:hypothetical protein ACMYLP_23160, partial [Salmonella enterica subsp. enterica serovar Enteritidis]|uniref:hypothetical protein n=1 Tax=Salmonella enterica TaxID=28901 RepID=UPI0039E8F372